MAKSQTTFNKKDREKKKQQKRKEKEARRQERKEQEKDSSLDSMMAYVDEYGNITTTPPDPNQKKKEVKASSIDTGVPKQEKEDPNVERRGRVTFYNDSKGYGFINQDGNQERFFVHANNANRALQEGDKVKFMVEQGPKGLVAVKVEVLN